MTTTPVNPEPPRRGDQCICQDPAVDRLRDLDMIEQITGQSHG